MRFQTALNRVRAILLVSESENRGGMKSFVFNLTTTIKFQNPKYHSDNGDGSIGQRAYKYKDPSDPATILVSNSVRTKYADAWRPGLKPMLFTFGKRNIHFQNTTRSSD
jgi:hypothetical protein